MEAYLTRVVEYLLGQSWQIAILTVVVAAATFALRNRSAHIRYLLWLIVLAKCLVPPLYSVPLGILPPETLADGRSFALLPEMFANVTEVGEPAEVPADTTRTESAKPGMISAGTSARARVTQWLAIAWLAGAGVYLLMNALRALRANLWLRKKRRRLPAELQKDIAALFAAYHLKHFPKIYLIDGMSQPFVWGVLRGSIYLPADFANVSNPAHRRNVLSHELSHVLRFDAAVNLLQVIAQAMFWFHPFVWWANRKMRAEREKCCDEMAIARLKALPKDYSTAIVEILTVRNKSTRPVPSLAIAGPVKNIEERIRTMLRPGKKFYKRPSLIAMTIVLLLALVTVPTALVLTARAETKAAPASGDKPTKTLPEAAADGDIEHVKLLISKGADVSAKDRMGRAALHRAAEKGHTDLVKLLIYRGADINATNRAGRTPLHLAAQEGHTDVAKLLIDRGADVNAKDRNQGTPLHRAAMKGNKKTIELLLSKGVDINAKDRQGCTPLFAAMTSTRPSRKELVELLVAKGATVSAFHLAAYMGDIEKLKECLAEGVKVDAPGDCNSTALHLAANSGKKDIVEFLVGKGANVDAKAWGWTPLLYAASHNYEDIADLLLAKGANVEAKDERGYTLLHYAIWEQDRNAVQLLISKGANVNIQDERGYTPLVWAIWMDDKDIVELLISKGADINSEDKTGYTPMYWAAMMGSKDLVDLLTAKGAAAVSTIHLAAATGDLDKVKTFIEKGTDVNTKDKLGFTALQWAILQNHKDVAAFLIDKGADINARDKRDQTLLHQACLGGHMEIAELLISKGADVKDRARNGTTPLHNAARMGHRDIVELLIAKGADVSAEDKAGVTPLGLAEENGHREIAELLRKHGADISVAMGVTPLHRAAAIGSIAQVKLLISEGADVNAKTTRGRTPLHIAANSGHGDVVELLIAKGADVNARTKPGATPLHLAAMFGHRDVADLLIVRGADVNAKDNAGKTPLHIVVGGLRREIKVGRGHWEVAELLIAKGSNVNVEDRRGRTPLDYAEEEGHAEIVELLRKHGAEE